MEHYVFTVPHGTKVEIKYEERRAPNRRMYQYKTSADPRIRALERRKPIAGIKYWAPMKLERRVAQRRVIGSFSLLRHPQGLDRRKP